MKKKGFTLIELLAVIVILAIIALIATPLVLKYIEKSRQESKVDSAYSFVRNLETEIANFSIKNNGKKYNGQPTDKGYYELTSFENSEIDTTVKGDNPDDGKVCISSLGQVEKAILQYGKYYVSYDGKKGSISDQDAYDNFSCKNVAGGNVTKVDVPEATKEFNMFGMANYGSFQNNQGIVYFDADEEKEELEKENDIFRLGYTYSLNSYEVPVTLFKQTPPADNNVIPVEIRFLDGTTSTINLEYTQNDGGYMVYYYKSNDNPPYHEQYNEGWSIMFRPYCNDHYGDCPTDYSFHYFYVNGAMSTTHPWHSLTILGTTLYFNSDVANLFVSSDVNTSDFNMLFQDYTKITKVIVNYEDNTQDIYNVTEKDFDDEGNLAIKNGNRILRILDKFQLEIHYKNNNFEYKKDIFADMPKVSTVTFEENGVMTTYKISDNPMIVYGGLGD